MKPRKLVFKFSPVIERINHRISGGIKESDMGNHHKAQVWVGTGSCFQSDGALLHCFCFLEPNSLYSNGSRPVVLRFPLQLGYALQSKFYMTWLKYIQLALAVMISCFATIASVEPEASDCPQVYAKIAPRRGEIEVPILQSNGEDPLLRELADLVYPNGDPASVLPFKDRDSALMLFDEIDAYNAGQYLRSKGLNVSSLSPENQQFLLTALKRRGFAQHDWESWNNSRNPDSIHSQLLARNINASPGLLDRAIAFATSNDTRPGIRAFPARKPGEPGYINPENLPGATALVIPGNPNIAADGVVEYAHGRVNTLLKRPEGMRVAPGTVFLSDIHAGRPDGEEANFLRVIDVLSRNPPSRLVLGGDLIDAPSFGRQMNRINEALGKLGELKTPIDSTALRKIYDELSYVEQHMLERIEALRRERAELASDPSRFPIAKELSITETEFLRRSRFQELLQFVKDKLPDTKIIFQFGNHDLARRSLLESRPMASDFKIGETIIPVTLIPKIELTSKATLPENWLDRFRQDLRVQLGRQLKGRFSAAEHGRKMEEFDRLDPSKILEIARRYYLIKGQSSKPEEMTKFPYYWEAAGKKLAANLESMGIEVSGVRSDKYFSLKLNDSDPSEVLIAHEPQENGPNINRIYSWKPTVLGGQSRFPANTRAIIAFDQHTSGTIVMEIDGKPV